MKLIDKGDNVQVPQESVNYYTQALAIPGGSKSITYHRRATAHHWCQNYAQTIDDAKQAIKIELADPEPNHKLLSQFE